MRAYRIGDTVQIKGIDYVVEDYDNENFYLKDDNDLVMSIPREEEITEGNECKAKELILGIKIASINLKTLHRNLTGGNWFRIHEQLGDYYDKIDEFEDSIIENFMAMGIEDVSVAEGLNMILPIQKYDEKTAMEIAKKMLDNIKALSMDTRTNCNISTDVAPVLDELEQWIHVESDYKIANYLNGKE